MYPRFQEPPAQMTSWCVQRLHVVMWWCHFLCRRLTCTGYCSDLGPTAMSHTHTRAHTPAHTRLGPRSGSLGVFTDAVFGHWCSSNLPAVVEFNVQQMEFKGFKKRLWCVVNCVCVQECVSAGDLCAPVVHSAQFIYSRGTLNTDGYYHKWNPGTWGQSRTFSLHWKKIWKFFHLICCRWPQEI